MALELCSSNAFEKIPLEVLVKFEKKNKSTFKVLENSLKISFVVLENSFLNAINNPHL